MERGRRDRAVDRETLRGRTYKTSSSFLQNMVNVTASIVLVMCSYL